MHKPRIERNNVGGRPRKFPEASRPVTVTLPEKTLRDLARVDPDRARSIVKAAEIAIGATETRVPTVEVVEIAKGTGLLLVGPNRSLKRIPWLRLVEISPCRYLLSIPTGTAVESLEVGIIDLIDHLPPEEADEREMLTRLRQLIRTMRREQTVSKAEILIVNTQSQPQAPIARTGNLPAADRWRVRQGDFSSR